MQPLRWLCDFFVLYFVVVDHNDWIAYVDPALQIWNESNLTVSYDPSSVLLDLAC